MNKENHKGETRKTPASAILLVRQAPHYHWGSRFHLAGFWRFHFWQTFGLATTPLSVIFLGTEDLLFTGLVLCNHEPDCRHAAFMSPVQHYMKKCLRLKA